MADTKIEDKIVQPALGKVEAPLASRAAKEVENRTHALSKSSFRSLSESRIEGLLEKSKIETLSSKDLMFLVQQLQTLIAHEHTRILGPHLQAMSDRGKQECEDLSAEQKAKKATIPEALSGVGSLAAAILAALKAAGHAVPLLPAFLAGGEVISSGAQMVGAFGRISEKYSQANQTELRHTYTWTEERLKEVRSVRDQTMNEKNQALRKLEELESAYYRFVSELLTRQG